jgi:hypothetical protein
MRNVLLTYALAAASTEGFEVDIDPISDMSDDEFGLSLYVRYSGMDISLEFNLLEENVRQGSGHGMAFGLTIEGDGGSIIGGMTPFNYTPGLWVYTKADLEERFKMFENSDPQAFVDLVLEWAGVHESKPEAGQLNLTLPTR